MLKPLDESLRQLEVDDPHRSGSHLRPRQALGRGARPVRCRRATAARCRNQYFFLARKVIFEAKAGQGDESDQFSHEAQAALNEPTPLWLALSIESIRYG